MSATRINKTTISTVLVSFEVKDNKGRLIGAQITRLEADFVEPNKDLDQADWRNRYPTSYDFRGHYFGFHAMAARAGKTYGAAQNPRWFPTAEARDQAIADYIAGAQKRANKKAAA